MDNGENIEYNEPGPSTRRPAIELENMMMNQKETKLMHQPKNNFMHLMRMKVEALLLPYLIVEHGVNADVRKIRKLEMRSMKVSHRN